MVGVQSFYEGRQHEGVARGTGPAGGVVLSSHEPTIRFWRSEDVHDVGVGACLVLSRPRGVDTGYEQRSIWHLGLLWDGGEAHPEALG